MKTFFGNRKYPFKERQDTELFSNFGIKLNLIYMKTKLIVTVVSIFFSGLVIGQDCSFYYPEMVGAELVYKNYDKKDKFVSKNSQQVISYTKTSAGAEATILSKSYDDKDKLTGENTLTVYCKAGVFYFDMKGYLSPETMTAYKDMEIKVDCKNLEVPSRLHVGDKLNDGSLTMDISTSGFKIMSIVILITERMVEAEENVTTPAGTFKCFKISQTISSKVGVKVVTKSYEWLASGIGTIKNESYSSDGKLNSRMELVEFKK